MALQGWRAEVAKEHELPACEIFHHVRLAAIAGRAPQSLGISGIGARKLEACGQEVWRGMQGV